MALHALACPSCRFCIGQKPSTSFLFVLPHHAPHWDVISLLNDNQLLIVHMKGQLSSSCMLRGTAHAAQLKDMLARHRVGVRHT